MKLTINTKKLQEMVSKAVKGASCNKSIPLTGMICIEHKKDVLTLITNIDMTHYLYISADKIPGDEFYMVVGVEQFSKLISKMTCDTITLEATDSSLEIKGNGKYTIEIPLDENGEPIKYPNPRESASDFDTSKIINRTTIQAILNGVKPALAVTDEEPCYTGYYVGDSVVGTDASKIASLGIKVLDDDVLISAELMNLLDVIDEEKIAVGCEGNVIIFDTDNCYIYGRTMDCIDDYEIEAITGLVETEFKSTCKVAKDKILSALDRVALFVGKYDNETVTLTFTNEGIKIASVQSTGIETVDYVESKSFKPFECSINVFMLAEQIKSNASDTVEIQYGRDESIKIVDGNMIKIVALNEEE